MNRGAAVAAVLLYILLAACGANPTPTAAPTITPVEDTPTPGPDVLAGTQWTLALLHGQLDSNWHARADGQSLLFARKP